MEHLEITTMGKKGQVVIPKSVRDRLGLGPHSKLVVHSSGDLVVMKKLTMANVSNEFEELFRSVDARDHGITEDDVDHEVQAVRKGKRERAKKQDTDRR